jgi:hypothetical protein
LLSDVLAELDVGDAALGDEGTDEPLAGTHVVAGLAGVRSSSTRGGACAAKTYYGPPDDNVYEIMQRSAEV